MRASGASSSASRSVPSPSSFPAKSSCPTHGGLRRAVSTRCSRSGPRRPPASRPCAYEPRAARPPPRRRAAERRTAERTEGPMESLVWTLRTMNGVALAPFLTVLVVVLVVCWDYPLLVPYFLTCRALGLNPFGRTDDAAPLDVLVVIPSLLRKRDE